MASESPRNPNIRELQSLRIARAGEPKKTSRLLIGAVVVIIGALVTAGGYEVYRRTLGLPPEVRTVVVTVRRAGRPGVILTGTGYVVTRHKYITIGTKVLGQIVAEPIEEGQYVKKGDLLARIDDRDYKARLNQALADRDLAAANLKLRMARARRIRQLYRNQVASRDELDAAENAVAVAKAELKRADAAIDFARFNVAQCTITSPVNGIVLRKYREIGDTIGPTTNIVQLADTEDMRIEVDINESSISKVKLGSPARITPDAYPDRSFKASVVKIYPAANRQKGTVKVEVKILHPDLKIIKPEMSAKVSFVAAEPAREQPGQPMILLPQKAVVDRETEPYVWLVRDGVVTRRHVALGREFQGGVEVLSGLSGGEMVIVVPPPTLKNGDRVTPRPA